MAKAKKYRLAQIVERFGGEIIGDPRTPISQVATLENAARQHIGFLSHGKYRKQLAGTRAGAVILREPTAALPSCRASSAMILICISPKSRLCSIRHRQSSPGCTGPR